MKTSEKIRVFRVRRIEPYCWWQAECPRCPDAGYLFDTWDRAVQFASQHDRNFHLP